MQGICHFFVVKMFSFNTTMKYMTFFKTVANGRLLSVPPRSEIDVHPSRSASRRLACAVTSSSRGPVPPFSGVYLIDIYRKFCSHLLWTYFEFRIVMNINLLCIFNITNRSLNLLQTQYKDLLPLEQSGMLEPHVVSTAVVK